MPNTVQLKKSAVAGKVPVVGDLTYGELAINYYDGKLYYKSTSNTILQINAKDADTLDGKHASSFVTIAGTETVTGSKTFSAAATFSGSSFFVTSPTITIGDPYASATITIGDVATSVAIGPSASLATFGSSAAEASFGDNASSATFATGSSSAVFGGMGYENTFGESSDYNHFGFSAGTNNFGVDAMTNNFGSLSTYNYIDGTTYINEVDIGTFSDPASMRSKLGIQTAVARARMWECLQYVPILWGTSQLYYNINIINANTPALKTVQVSNVGIGGQGGTGAGASINADFTVSGLLSLITASSTSGAAPSFQTATSGITSGATSFVASADPSSYIFANTLLKHASLAAGTKVTSVAGTTVNFTPAATGTSSGTQSVGYSHDNLLRFAIGGGSAAATVGRYIDAPTVIPTGTYTSGTNTITVSANTSIVVGQSVHGRGIPYGTMVTAINSTTITLNQNVTTSETSRNVEFMTFSPQATPTASYTSGQASMVVSSATGVAVGYWVYGPGIPAGTSVSAVNGTTITLSNAVTETRSSTMVGVVNNTNIVTNVAIGIEQYADPSSYAPLVRIYGRLGPIIIYSSGVNFNHLWNYYYKFALDYRNSDGRVRLFMERQTADAKGLHRLDIPAPITPTCSINAPFLRNRRTAISYFAATHNCAAVDSGTTATNQINVFGTIFQSPVLFDDN